MLARLSNVDNDHNHIMGLNVFFLSTVKQKCLAS